jgi:hypothetical protein
LNLAKFVRTCWQKEEFELIAYITEELDKAIETSSGQLEFMEKMHEQVSRHPYPSLSPPWFVGVYGGMDCSVTVKFAEGNYVRYSSWVT